MNQNHGFFRFNFLTSLKAPEEEEMVLCTLAPGLPPEKSETPQPCSEGPRPNPEGSRRDINVFSFATVGR